MSIAGKVIFVANLPVGVDELGTHELFAEHGVVVRVRLLRIAGCAFVEFAESREANAAVTALHGMHLGGAPLRLELTTLVA